MLNHLSKETTEWYQQAVYCARQAHSQTNPRVKRQFLELKRLWLLLAGSYEFTGADETKRQADKSPNELRR